MPKESIIVTKSYNFALKIVKVVASLPKNSAGQVLGKQLIKSGTSIGANVEEAQGAASKKDFINKITISNKEARETRYWLKLIRDSKMIKIDQVELLLEDCDAIINILTAIIKTSKHSMNSK